LRRGRDAAYTFMSAAAGNLPGFEEAVRALYPRTSGGRWRRASTTACCCAWSC
ncbi:DUF2239 family protein, partial [Bordetella pertussis]|uniref:DUF2239 family protein n=1 Tax=Bordetella pertussis TaxID=520 RepID=UPI0038799C45